MPPTRPAEYPEIRADASLAPRDVAAREQAARDAAAGREPGLPDAGPRPRSRPSRELRYLVLVLGASLLVMPLMVYLSGALTLGPYEGGLGAFLANLYGDFATLAPGAWALLAGPYALFWALRLTTRPLRRRRSA